MGDFDRSLEYTRGIANSSINSYYSGIIDYLKWTTTLSIAALVWIGNFFLTLPESSSGISKSLLFAAIVAIGYSIVVAIVGVYRILAYWERELSYIQDHLISMNDLLKEQSMDEDMLEETYKFHFPDVDKVRQGFSATFKPYLSKWIAFHTGSLLLGIVAYLLALGVIKSGGI